MKALILFTIDLFLFGFWPTVALFAFAVFIVHALKIDLDREPTSRIN